MTYFFIKTTKNPGGIRERIPPGVMIIGFITAVFLELLGAITILADGLFGAGIEVTGVAAAVTAAPDTDIGFIVSAGHALALYIAAMIIVIVA